MDAPVSSAVAASERAVYRDYERNRRLQLARILLPVLALVQFAVVVVSVLFLPGARFSPMVQRIFIFNTALVGVDAALHALGMRFVRRGRVTPATLSVIIPVGVTVVLPILIYDLAGQEAFGATSPILSITLGEMTGTFVLIVLAGLLATDRRVLVGTTLLMNVFAVFILTSALQSPGAGSALREQAVLLVSFPVFVQWAVAGLLFAAAGTSLRTLRELGDVRVAYERARQLDQLKDQFISHVNHELRSPVMALQGHVELLLLTQDGLTPDERRAYLERAKRAGDDLVALVTSILAARTIGQEAETVAPEAVAVAEALTSALLLVDPRDGRQVERELRVSIPAGMEVWAEPVRVRQILTNLLSNAVKYSPPGTPVEVSARIVAAAPDEPRRRMLAKRTAPQPRQMAEIAVRDYGAGIPPDQAPLLFNRFVRLPRDLASNVPGNGLGLYLCRALADTLGGSITVESQGIVGEGATFYLRLPLPPQTGG
ncbi:MAG TPA: HAMP domain-containing sensor histidine kinase [Ktedonobacterales bacterium]|jgi:signal transduction histidine kinase|nr:HAMP domain-containing sensor histidine kinase [Ktedonobacterales bacterium]